MNAAPELLKAAAQGDEQACEQMLRENSGLIWSIVQCILQQGGHCGKGIRRGNRYG